jgi:hypothetical protein
MAEKNPAKHRIKRHVGSVPSLAMTSAQIPTMAPATVSEGITYLPAEFSAEKG